VNSEPTPNEHKIENLRAPIV